MDTALDVADDYAQVLSSSMPTQAIIQGHLKDMMRVFDSTKRITDPIELYVMFLYMEKEYADRNAHNYAETVHLLNSQLYQNDLKNPYIAPNMSMMERLRCPSCSTRLKPKQAYEVHLLNQSAKCRNCSSTITFEAMCIATFCKDYRRGRYEKLRKCRVKFQYNEQYCTWRKFTEYLNTVLRNEVVRMEKTKESRKEISDEWRESLYKMLSLARNNISKFSFDLVPGMYRQLDFIVRVCENYDYWKDEKVLEESIKRYHKFMVLMRNLPKKKLIPTLDIELTWRAHQTHPSTYTKYSYTIHRRIVDYDDSLQGKELEVAFAKTYIHWSKYYDEPYSPSTPSFFSWLRGHYRLSLLLPPVGLYRLFTWMRYRKVVGSNDSQKNGIGSSLLFESKGGAKSGSKSSSMPKHDQHFGVQADGLLSLYLDGLETQSDVGSFRGNRSGSMDSDATFDFENPGSLRRRDSVESMASSVDGWTNTLSNVKDIPVNNDKPDDINSSFSDYESPKPSVLNNAPRPLSSNVSFMSTSSIDPKKSISHTIEKIDTNMSSDFNDSSYDISMENEAFNNLRPTEPLIIQTSQKSLSLRNVSPDAVTDVPDYQDSPTHSDKTDKTSSPEVSPVRRSIDSNQSASELRRSIGSNSSDSNPPTPTASILKKRTSEKKSISSVAFEVLTTPSSLGSRLSGKQTKSPRSRVSFVGIDDSPEKSSPRSSSDSPRSSLAKDAGPYVRFAENENEVDVTPDPDAAT